MEGNKWTILSSVVLVGQLLILCWERKGSHPRRVDDVISVHKGTNSGMHMGICTTYGLPTASLEGSEQVLVHLSADYHYGILTSRKVVALVNKSVMPDQPASTSSSLDRIPMSGGRSSGIYTGTGIDHKV